MNSISATFNSSAVNIIDIQIAGSTYNVIYIDASNNVKIQRCMMNSDGSALVKGTSGIFN